MTITFKTAFDNFLKKPIIVFKVFLIIKYYCLKLNYCQLVTSITVLKHYLSRDRWEVLQLKTELYSTCEK